MTHEQSGAEGGSQIAAACYKAKYHKHDPETGKAMKIRVQVQNMGVHKKNRGGVYPAGVRCKSLRAEVVQTGFVKEDLNHA